MKSRTEKTAWLTLFLKPIGFGLLVGAIASLGMLLLMAAAATAVDLPQGTVLPLATFAVALGTFLGAFTAAKIAGKNGWLFGTLTAVVLFVFSVLAGLGLYNQIDASFLLIKALIMLAAGILAGVFAVNSGKHKRK